MFEALGIRDFKSTAIADAMFQAAQAKGPVMAIDGAATKHMRIAGNLCPPGGTGLGGLVEGIGAQSRGYAARQEPRRIV